MLTVTTWARAAGAVAVGGVWLCLCVAGCSQDGLRASDGGGDSDGGVAGSVEPLLLTVPMTAGPSLGPFTLYDRHGAVAGDLATALSLGSSWDGIELTVGDRLLVARSPTLSARRVLLVSEPIAPSSDTQVIVRAADATDKPPNVRVIGLGVDGRHTFDLALDGGPSWFRLSPTGRYVFGDDGSSAAVIADTTGGAPLQLSGFERAAFLRDDSALIYTTSVSGGSYSVVVQPLPGGAPVFHTHPGTPGVSSYLLVEAATAARGAILREYGDVSFGQHLFFFGSDGNWTPFDAAGTAFAVDTLLGWTRGGEVAVYAHTPSAGHERDFPPAVLGFDTVARAVVRYDAALGALAGDHLFDVAGADLRAWTLLDAAPRAITTLPSLGTDGWQRSLGPFSDDGSILGVSAMWTRNAEPSSFPVDATLVLDGGGRRHLTLPVGDGALDRSGQMFVLLPEDPTMRGKLAIGDVVGGGVTWLSEPSPHAFVYRRR